MPIATNVYTSDVMIKAVFELIALSLTLRNMINNKKESII